MKGLEGGRGMCVGWGLVVAGGEVGWFGWDIVAVARYGWSLGILLRWGMVDRFDSGYAGDDTIKLFR